MHFLVCHGVLILTAIRVFPAACGILRGISAAYALCFSIIKGFAALVSDDGDVGRHATLLGAKGVWSIFHLLLRLKRE